MIMEIGIKVRILPYSEYKGRFTGYVGTVERITSLCSSIGIRFENETNTASTYGVFWFSEKHLEIIEMENEFMNENFVVAGIKFLDGTNIDREYAYALYDENIAVGDIVAVKTGHHGFALAEIASIGNFPHSAVQCGREVIDRVDFTAYAERKEKAKRLRALRVEMDEKVKQLQQTALYELLAEKDPTLKAMLEEYKSLIG